MSNHVKRVYWLEHVFQENKMKYFCLKLLILLEYWWKLNLNASENHVSHLPASKSTYGLYCRSSKKGTFTGWEKVRNSNFEIQNQFSAYLDRWKLFQSKTPSLQKCICKTRFQSRIRWKLSSHGSAKILFLIVELRRCSTLIGWANGASVTLSLIIFRGCLRIAFVFCIIRSLAFQVPYTRSTWPSKYFTK